MSNPNFDKEVRATIVRGIAWIIAYNVIVGSVLLWELFGNELQFVNAPENQWLVVFICVAALVLEYVVSYIALIRPFQKLKR